MKHYCRGGLLGQSFVSSGHGRGPLQDEDHSGSRPRSFLGLCLEFSVFRWALGCLCLWKGLATCLSGVLRYSPLFRKRHPYTQFSFLSRRGRRCGGWASSWIDSSGFIRFKCFVCRQVPVYSSRVVIRRVENVVVRSRVCCLPVVYRAQIHWGR